MRSKKLIADFYKRDGITNECTYERINRRMERQKPYTPRHKCREYNNVCKIQEKFMFHKFLLK